VSTLSNRTELENELADLGLLEKAREIRNELGNRAALSYIKSGHRLLSKVYHPDLNPNRQDKATKIQQRLNRVSSSISRMEDKDLVDLIKNVSGVEPDAKRKVLIVDDETDLQILFGNVLKMEGYKVRTADNGANGLSEYIRFKPDLILTDVVMPQLTGIQMVKRIRETHFPVKVVYMSGFFGLEGIKSELDAEIASFGYPSLAKPFKISVLLNVVNEYLERSESTGFRRGV